MLVVYILIHMFYTRSYIELQRVDAVRSFALTLRLHCRQACTSSQLTAGPAPIPPLK